MGLLRLTVLGAAAIGLYRYVTGSSAPSNRGVSGLAATYRTREEADVAVEHLVQQHGVDRSAIFVEAASDENTAGSAISGGDAPSGDRDVKARDDAPLHGNLRVTVATDGSMIGKLRSALADAGALEIRIIQ